MAGTASPTWYSDKDAAFDEIDRVLRPGGRFAGLDFDVAALHCGGDVAGGVAAAGAAAAGHAAKSRMGRRRSVRGRSASGGRTETATVALHQGDAHLSLERVDRRGHRRLGDDQLGGGGRDGSTLHGPQERDELRDGDRHGSGVKRGIGPCGQPDFDARGGAAGGDGRTRPDELVEHEQLHERQ